MLDDGLYTNYSVLPSLYTGALNNEGMQESSKNSHDTYRVFVNNDYIGNKVLLAQNEEIEDVGKYLNNKGFRDFTTKLTGNEYVINPTEEDSLQIKNTLQTYLHTR